MPNVNAINTNIQNMLPGEVTTYKSVNTVMNQDEAVNYPTELLNSLDLHKLPKHIMHLKIGVLYIDITYVSIIFLKILIHHVFTEEPDLQ